MKKLTAIFCSILTMSLAFLTVSGCKQEKTGSVMNVSLNPEVEFILDENDKVISVNALNEEGNLIISSVSFTGKSAGEAVELFVSITDEMGFLFEGSVKSGENELEISVSGNEVSAKKLFDTIESKVEKYFEEHDIQGVITQGKAITEEQLRALAQECAPYIEQAKLQALTYAELLETVAESRKETAEMYSQEVKKAYYEAKAFAMQQAEIEVIKSHLDALSQGACDMAFSIYEGLVDVIEGTRLTMLVNEDSPYQIALRAFQQAKVDYLKYRDYVASLEQNAITAEISALLTQYETVLQTAETALIKAGNNASQALDTAKAQATTAYDKVIQAIGEYSAKASEYADEISTKVTEAKTQFFTEFESNYQSFIDSATQGWADMKAQLTAEEEN